MNKWVSEDINYQWIKDELLINKFNTEWITEWIDE